IGRPIVENPYHQHIIRTNLTRNLHARFPEVRDEIACAFEEVLQLQGSGEEMIVARVSNRLFVGLPLCRNQTYLWNNVLFALDVIRSGQRVALFPDFLRPLVSSLLSSKDKSFAVALETLGPLVAERLAKEDELGPDWPGKPVTFLQRRMAGEPAAHM
ncbi:hypothetical protein K438DRAFT_1572538, partial [Mycena galopus ATCC 62051]